MDDDADMGPGDFVVQPITARCTADPTHRDLEWSLVKGVLTTWCGHCGAPVVGDGPW